MKVCIPFTDVEDEIIRWDYLLQNYNPKAIYIKGKEGDQLPMDSRFYGRGYLITKYEHLPDDPKVLLASKYGRFFQGNENLKQFKHPEEAIYIVGNNHSNLTEELLGDCKLDHLVFIDDVEMFNDVSLGIALYDREIKNG